MTSANHTALSMWGRSAEEVIGRTLAETFPQAVGSEAYLAHLQAMRSLKPFRGLVRSPVLHRPVELEIHPSREGLRVTFRMEDLDQAPPLLA